MPRYDDDVIHIIDKKDANCLRKNKNCHQCSVKLKIGDSVRFAGRKGKLKVYHDKCWVRY